MATVNQTPAAVEGRSAAGATALRLLLSLVLLAGLAVLLWLSFVFMRNEEAPRLVVAGTALTVGVAGIWAFYWILNDIVSRLPSERVRSLFLPYVFIGPALILLAAYLVFPAIRTIWISFMDARSTSYVGLENYVYAFTEPAIQIAFRNNLLWLVFVTGFSVTIGLVVAVLFDRVRYEAAAKSFVFLPLVISAVGASAIWRFMYAYAPAEAPQIGLLNAIVVGLGGEPVPWLINRSVNNFALIAIMIWMQTGFCMVIFSAALKGVPAEIVEAARIDGASEIQIFFRILIPSIQGTIITVATTVLVAVLKVFDIVFVMTSGQFGTEVLANRMYSEMFRFRNFGHGSALAVILLIAVLPIMIINVRNLRQQRSH